MPYCESCGTKLDKTTKFCTNCGVKVVDYTHQEDKPVNSKFSPSKRGNPKTLRYPQKNIKQSKSIIGLVIFLVFAGLIGSGIYYMINSNKASTYNRDFGYTDYVASNPFDEISINQDISNQVDNSALIESLGLTGDEIIKIKKILSDPNPDPEYKSNEYCGQTQHKCKWCGSEYYVSSYYKPIQEYINFTLQFDGLSAVTANLQKMFGGNPASEFREFINSYERGNKYTCTSESDNGGFCSPRCKEEEKYSRY